MKRWAEAKGDRSSNAMKYRRVDVMIESNQRVSGTAGASRPLLTRSTASRFWHVSVDMSAGGSLGAAGSLLSLTLYNDMSNQSMTGKVFAGGGGPKASLGASSVDLERSDRLLHRRAGQLPGLRWDVDPVHDHRREPLHRLRVVVHRLLRDGQRCPDIDVGGWNTGTVGIGGSAVTGPLSLDGAYPPTQLPIKDSDTTFVPYQRNEGGKDVHQVLFPTGEHELPDLETDILESFLMSVVASKR